MTKGVAVVTGGSRGIGRAIVRRLHTEGYDVVFTHSASPQEARAVAAPPDGSPCIVGVQVDVADVGAPGRILDVASGLGRLAVLVNNAGITGRLGPITELSDMDLARVLAVNVAAPLRLCREALRRHDGGPLDIVNISSIAARSGSPGEYVAYAASKAALETATVGLAKEQAAVGVRVNAVAPGFIDTTIHARAGEPNRAFRLGATTPLGRPGTGEEIAAAVAWLISGDARYVTGQVLAVAGGA